MSLKQGEGHQIFTGGFSEFSISRLGSFRVTPHSVLLSSKHRPIQAFVTSRLDYYNELYVGLPLETVCKLPREPLRGS